jgi:hypothetical protein
MTTIDVDALANEIRRLGGTSVRGCVALAQGLMPFLASHTVDTREADGWMLVPVEPTDAMLEAGADAVYGSAPGPALMTYRAMLAAAPPSSPSERDAALEEAAKVCDDEADKRFAQARKADAGDASWGSDLQAAASAQDNKAITARSLATAIRALKASRSDTVGPEAGE